MPITVSSKYITSVNNSQKAYSASSVSSTQEISIFDEAKKSEQKQAQIASNDKNPEATLDRQTCLTLKISEEDWNKMSQEEKQLANDKAIIKIVDDFNNAWYNKLLGRKTSYEAQYRRYLQRSTSAEESARIASVLKQFDEKSQRKALEYHKNNEVDYKSNACKESAQTVIANDYIEYKPQNQALAVEGLVNTKAKEEILLIATQNSTKADVKYQADVVKALMSAENENVDLTIASQQGQYGIDKDGNKNTEVELNVFKQINTSKYEKALEVAAQNIAKLDVKNREKAVEVVKSTNNEKAIKAINTVDDKASDLSAAVKNNDKSAIQNCLNTMTTTEIAQLISTNNNSDFINAILASNPSQAVLTVINNAVKNNSVKLNYKNSIKEIGFFGSSVQIEMLKQAAKENNLGSIERVSLNSAARKQYDELSAKLQLMA